MIYQLLCFFETLVAIFLLGLSLEVVFFVAFFRAPGLYKRPPQAKKGVRKFNLIHVTPGWWAEFGKKSKNHFGRPSRDGPSRERAVTDKN